MFFSFITYFQYYQSNLAYDNSRFSSLFSARDVSRGGTSATQRQKFHGDDVNQYLHNTSGSHGVPHPNLFNFTFPLIDFTRVFFSSANELQQNSNASSREQYIPPILTVLLEIHRVYSWPSWPFVFWAIPIKCFVSHRPVSCNGGSVGRAKKKEWTLEGVWVPGKAGLLSKKAWFTKSTLKRGLFDYQMSKQPLKNIVSMLIEDKDITSYIPIAVNKTRSCACKLKYSLRWLVNLFFFYFSKKMGRSGDEKRNILLGWPCLSLVNNS